MGPWCHHPTSVPHLIDGLVAEWEQISDAKISRSGGKTLFLCNHSIVEKERQKKKLKRINKGKIWGQRPITMSSLLSGEDAKRHGAPSAKPRQTDDGAAAVIAIGPLCIKHTFVESSKRREKRGRCRKGAKWTVASRVSESYLFLSSFLCPSSLASLNSKTVKAIPLAAVQHLRRV